MISVLLMGCGDAQMVTSSTVEPAAVEINAQVDSPKVDAGGTITLTIEVHHSNGIEALSLAPPQATGMTISKLEGPVQAAIGARIQEQWMFSLTAPPGSYVIYPGAVQLEGAEPVIAEPLFVDVGVQGPVSELADLAPPPAVEPTSHSSWVWAIAGGAILLLGLGFGLTQLSNRKSPPEDPVQIANSRYQQLLAQELDAHGKSVELSRIVRQFIADICLEPMVMTMSPNELQAWLLVPRSNLVHPTELIQLLLALDSYKFSRIGGDDNWWKTQEARFNHAIVAPTEPS